MLIVINRYHINIRAALPKADHAWFGFAFAVMVTASVASGQTETMQANLKLRTGGGLSGLVVDYTRHGLVIVHEKIPYVFAWDELESGCAYGTQRTLLTRQRGGESRLSAEDHFRLGLFALTTGRDDLAANEFRRAKRLSREYASLIKEAVDDYRLQEAASRADHYPLAEEVSVAGSDAPQTSGLPIHVEVDLTNRLKSLSPIPKVATGPLHNSRAQVLEAYKAFGEKAKKVIGKDVVLIESDHFLIWTDWERRHRDRLLEWCESMYTALCKQFDLNPSEDIFLAKCPVFCWRSKARFQRFARQFDGYDGVNAIGYTRSIEANGHVHVVLLRQGRSEADFDRFACTLVHEGTHAFLHRLYTSRLIPHWINEGYADLTAERVLGDRCPAGENAALLARQIVHYDWPIRELLHSAGPIEVHQYPLAHSVIAYLESLGPDRFAGFIRDLKAGKPVDAALAVRYDNLTLDQLEAQWRSHVGQ